MDRYSRWELLLGWLAVLTGFILIYWAFLAPIFSRATGRTA